MAWTPYQIFLAIMMVFTGSINTLATKWADKTKSVGKYGGEPRKFDHPFLQAVSMFIGELSCLLMFKVLYFYYKRKDYTDETMPPSVAGNRKFNPLIFLLPAMLDMTATSTMYIGLNMTYASSFQMLRGALIVFTGLLSVAFLNRKLKGYEWLGIFFVLIGLLIVGLSDMLTTDVERDTNSMITGDLLIIMAQIITAAQMVVEEKFVIGKNVSPLQAVGWEGFFGFSVLSILLIPMYYIHVGHMIFKNPDGQIEDAVDAMYQITNNWQTATGVLGTMVSIAFFNFSGISVTKQLSATTRTVLDSVRTLVIWLFSLAVEWQEFSILQLLGFVVLLFGMFLYNNVIIRPFLIKKGLLKRRDSDGNLEREPITTPEDQIISNGAINDADNHGHTINA